MIDRVVLVIGLRVGRSMGRRSRRSPLLLLKNPGPFWVVDCIVKLSIARRIGGLRSGCLYNILEETAAYRVNNEGLEYQVHACYYCCAHDF